MSRNPVRSSKHVVACMILGWIGGAAMGQEGVAPPEEKKPRVAWKYAPKGGSFHGVLVHDDTVFALDRSGKLHALDAASGKKRWSSEDEVKFGFAFGVAVSPNPEFQAIVVGSDIGLFALDRTTGKMLWHTPIAKGVAGPACTTERVVAGGADGKVYGCELTTGKIVWQHDYLKDAPKDPKGFSGDRARFGGKPARPSNATTDGEMVVLPIFDQCRALALDAKTGKRLWAFQTKGWMYGRAAIGARSVIVGSQDRHFYAVDKRTGKLAWKLKTKGRNEAPPTATGRFVYVGSCDSRVYAVDQGRVAWEFETDHKKGYGAPIYSKPLVVGGTLYQAAMMGKVYALARESGKLLWSLRPLSKSQINSDLVTDGKLLFLTTRPNGKAGESAVLAIVPK